MGLILGIIIFVILIALIALAVSKSTSYYRNRIKKDKRSSIVLFGLSLIVLIGFIFIPFGFTQVKTGEIAVVKVWGEAKEIKTAGLHFKNVASTDFEIYDLKTQEIIEVMEAYSLDAQVMTASIAIQYSIISANVIDINTKFGTLEVLNNRIKAICLEKAKVVLSSKSAMNLIETRSSLSQAVESAIRDNSSTYYISIEMVAITDIAFNDAFESAVENKMIAEQEKLKAQYDKDKAIIKAEEELAVAIKQAESAIETAKGAAQAEIEIANAQAKAIQIKAVEIARMMGFQIVETTNEDETTHEISISYEIITEGHTADEIKAINEYLKYIEYLSKWDGQLPETYVTGDTNSSILITP
jgi:regulator of protease activity HflC (stomatin/prohibitin superfamily)